MPAALARLTVPASADPALTPSLLLRSAATYIDTYGWTVGEFFANSDEGRPFPAACSLGAINICAHGRPILYSDDDAQDDDTDAAIVAMRVFAAYLDPDYGNPDPYHGTTSAIDIVSGFNDYDGRTINDVIDALNAAADEWDRLHPAGGAR
jgi:hypothetical protein